MPHPELMTAQAGMAGLIEASIRRAPDRTALGIADGSMRLTYGQLGRLTRSVARRLMRAGITRTDPIAIYSDNSPEFVLALLAAWSTGAVAVPMNPQLTSAEVHSRLAAVHARAVILPHRWRDRYPAGADAMTAWSMDIDAGHAEVALTDIRQPNSATSTAPPPRKPDMVHESGLALLMFTTGSTGTPKIVPLTHANLAASVHGIVSTYRLGADDPTLVAMPLFHGHGLIAGLLATLASGGSVYLPATGRFSARRFWDEIITSNATWYTAVPTVHQILLARAATDYPAAHPPRLRFIRSSSAPLAPAILHETEEQFGAPVIPAYGMTETAHQAASNPLPQDDACKGASVGRPTGLQIHVVNADGKQAATGETGEVVVRGPALTGGYFDDLQATTAAFTEGWFHTGDLGYLDSDGYLFLTGRTKEMINRGGEKIAPHAVEAVLLSHPAVQDAVTFAVPDAKYGEEVHAAVILRPGRHATQTSLQQHCRARLTTPEIPKEIDFLDRFPRTTKGDADRRALAAALKDESPP